MLRHSFVHGSQFTVLFTLLFTVLLTVFHYCWGPSIKHVWPQGEGFFQQKGGGNKLNIICSLTENLDEFKNQHIETCFEIKQVCTSIFKICFDIRWFFCKILCLYDAAISHIFLFCKNFTLFQMSITFPKIVIILMKFSLAYFAIFHFF